jgi:hypothetical protein
MPNFAKDTKGTGPTGAGFAGTQLGIEAPELAAYAMRVDGHLTRMLWFRRQYDQRRAFFYRQYIGQQDRKVFPDNVTPRSNTFVTYPLSNVEQIVARVSDAYFGFAPWFECKPRGANDDLAADCMQKILDYKLHQATTMQALEELIRNLCIYGHAGIKVEWNWDYDVAVQPNTVFVMQTVPDPQTGQMIQVPMQDPNTGAPIVDHVQPQMVKIPKMRPKFTPIDCFDLLVDPDGGMAAHMVDKNLGQILREQEASAEAAAQDPTGTMQPLYFPDAVETLRMRIAAMEKDDPDSVLVRLAEFWNEIDNTVTIQTYGKDQEAISWKDLRSSFRQASYSGWRRKVYGGEPILLYHGPNPFAHKRCPILATSFIKVPGEVFGLGAIEIISDLTASLNNFANMITDNWNLGINRRYAYDVNADIDHAALNMMNTPGGKIGGSGNPNEFIAPLPFFTPNKQDYAILDLYKGMIEMTSGVSDFYGKGVGQPTGNRTATGIGNVINESNFRFKLFIRNLELDIVQPLLQMSASLVQQYMTDEEEVRITDAPAGVAKWLRVSPQELIGNFDFELVAANYATNKVVRQRNLLAFANWAAQSPYWNQSNGLKEIAKVFEIRNVNSLLKPEQQVQQEQSAQQNAQLHLMLVEKLLDTESKAIIAELSRKPGQEGSTGIDQATKHAMVVQKFIEDFLQNYGGIPVESATAPLHGEMEDGPPGQGAGGGRPRGMQQEGKIPGHAETTATRSVAQSTGQGGMGLGAVGSPREA